ncbi:hypothetical protein PMAYCL1PPCAC_09462, partial [Pristionchus mayeri]
TTHNNSHDYDRCPELHVLNTVSELRYYEVPELAISMFLYLGLQFPPFDDNWVKQVVEFGEKWNNAWVGTLR